MDNGVKTDLLVRLFEGSPHVAGELRARVRASQAGASPPAAARTVADLRARVEAIRIARERERIARLEAEAARQAKAAERARRAHLDSIRRRGEAVWTAAEAEIERRNGAAYERAAALLHDLRAIADQDGST